MAFRIGITLLVVAIAGAAGLRLRLHGKRLARMITDPINDGILGRLEIESIEWRIVDMPKAITGGWLKVRVREVKVIDPFGATVISVPRAYAEIDAHAALYGNHDLIVRRLDIPGGDVLIRDAPVPLGVRPNPGERAAPAGRTQVTLVSAFYSNRRRAPDEPRTRGPTFDVRAAALDRVNVELDYPTFSGHFDDASGAGWLYYADQTGTPEGQRFSFSLSDTRAPRGHLDIHAIKPLDLLDVRVPEVAQVADRLAPREEDDAVDLAWRCTARTPEEARIEANGRLIKYFKNPAGGTYDILVMVDRAHDLAQRLSDGVVGGKTIRAALGMTGPMPSPRYRVVLSEAEVQLALEAPKPPIDVAIPTATFWYDRAIERGELKDTELLVGSGRVSASAAVAGGNEPNRGTLRIMRALDLSPWLDREAIATTGGARLRGRVDWRQHPRGIRANRIDLQIGRTHIEGSLIYDLSENRLDTRSLRAEQDGTEVNASGIVDLARARVNVAVAFVSRDLPRWLDRLNAPPTPVRFAEGTFRIAGDLTSPTIPDGEIKAGVDYIGSASAKLSYRNGLLEIREGATARPFGGNVQAEAALRVKEQPEIVELRIGGVGLELARIPLAGDLLQGTGRVSAQAAGPVDSTRATLVAEVDSFQFVGDDYRDFLVTGSRDESGAMNLQLHVDRDLGGRLDARGTVAPDGALNGTISLHDIPIESLPVIGDHDVPVVGGATNAELRIGGTLTAPTFAGRVESTRLWFKQAFLGAATLQLQEVGPGRTSVSGSLLHGLISVKGEIFTHPTLEARLQARFHRVELDQFFPELAKAHELRGWVSGTLDDVILRPNEPPHLTAHITELVVLKETEDPRGRARTITMRNAERVEISYRDGVARFVEPVQLRGTGIYIVASGTASPAQLNLTIDGSVGVATIQPYFLDRFDEASGQVTLSATLTGPATSPRIAAAFELTEVVLRVAGHDAEFQIPAAKIEITNDQIALTGVSVDLVEEGANQRATITLSGGISLDQFRPSSWTVMVTGQLAGKLLVMLRPSTFSAGSGSAELELSLLGNGLMPNIDGSLTFSEESPLRITPRGSRVEIALNDGTIELRESKLIIQEVQGTVDDSGKLTDINGEISLDDWQLASLDIDVRAEALPFRVPNTLELDLDVKRLNILLDRGDKLDIVGELDILNGRYVRNHMRVQDAITPERVRETEAPFYKELSILANADLDLRITTGGGFAIKNNIADVDLTGGLTIRGRPSNPTFDGTITVTRGSFKLQGMRARFTRSRGTVEFVPLDRFPQETPKLDITSEADYTDGSGQRHQIEMTIKGPLPQLDWDLRTTNTGLDKAGTMTLIWTGRTAEDNRALLGDTPVTREATAIEGGRSTANIEEGLGVADQFVKDIAGEFLSTLLEDPLRDITKLDVFRVTVGTTGFGARLEKKLSERAKLIGDFERTVRGYTVSARAEQRLGSSLSFELEWLIKEFDQDIEEDVNKGRALLLFRGKR